MRSLAFVFLGWCWLFGASVPAMGADTASAPGPTPAELAALDKLFLARDQAGPRAELEKGLREGLAANPTAYELLWRQSRLRLWFAEGQWEKDAKRDGAIAARGFAERAVAAKPEGVEGQYYAGASVGVYSQAVGILKAITEGLEGKFNGYVDKALALNPDFEQGAPRLAKGRYHYELPWPKRSLKKARALISEAVRKYPERARGRLYLAEVLLADDDAAGASRELQALRALPPGPDGLETARIQQRAEAVEKKVRDALK